MKCLLVNCEVNFILTWSSTCVITNSTGEGKFAITDTKHYVLEVTLPTQDHEKLPQQLKSGFKRAIYWNKYQSDPKAYAQNRNLNHLVDASFQGVNRLFVLSFESEDDIISHSTYYLSNVEIEDHNVMTDGKNLFDQPINSDLKTYENIRKIATGQQDDYTTGCLLGYSYFKVNYKIIAIDLSKQQVLDADLRAIQLTENLDKRRKHNNLLYY